MPSYTKFMKDIILTKWKLEENEKMILEEERSVVILNKLLPKLKDPRSFTIPYTIKNYHFSKVLCFLDALINLIPFLVFEKLRLTKIWRTTVFLPLAVKSKKHTKGIMEDVLVSIDKFVLIVDFLVLDIDVNYEVLLILGKPFLAIRKPLVDVHAGKLTLWVNDEEVVFNVFDYLKWHGEEDSMLSIDAVDKLVKNQVRIGDMQEDKMKECIQQSILGRKKHSKASLNY